MTDHINYLTHEGKAKLEAELRERETTIRREIAERINAAKELGDISESGEYEDAKKASGFNEGRIKEISEILKNHQIIEDVVGDVEKVRIGSTVTIRFDGETIDESYRIVGSAESNPAKGMISNESPLGIALIDKKVGEKAVFQSPANTTIRCTVTAIK
ncbi:MAG: transcription elongation factor GreA [Roseiflexaceae bacterium]